MPIAGLIAEGALVLVLMALVVAMIFGWKPKLMTALWLGAVIGVLNLTTLFFLQEKEPVVYFTTFAFFLVPLWLVYMGIKVSEGELLKKCLVVGCAASSIFYLELGMVLKNYLNLLSATVILIPVFLWWRDSKEEGFIRTKIGDWKVMLNAFFFFLISTVLMAVIGWESAMVTQYPGKFKWVPLISIIPFFLVKAIPEELVFRGVFQGALKDKFGFIPALIGASVLYGAMAINNPSLWAFPNWHAAVNALALGLACGIVYNKTKSLAVSGALNASVSYIWWLLFAHGGF